MLNVLMSVFVTFTIITQPMAVMQKNVIDFDYDPLTSISYNAREVEWYKVNLIGRHVFVKIDKCESLGAQPVELLTDMRNGKIMENVKIKEEVEAIQTTSLSTEIKCSSKMMTTLEVQAGIPGASVSAGKSVEAGYSFSKTTTYTTTIRKATTIEYEIKQEYIDDRRFCLGMVADVYKITWQTWQVDDYWWGDYEVSGSRKTYEGYITVRPYLTIVYDDGSFVA